MKVAVFSDVQGNLQAFEEAIALIDSWQPELVVTAGDLINRGPDNDACLAAFDRRRQEQGWIPVQGNHEVWVARWLRQGPKSAREASLFAFTDWACRQVAPLAHALNGWSDHLCFDAPAAAAARQADRWVHVTHGTLAGNRDGISASTPDLALADKLPPDLALFITGHTHKVHRRRYAGMDIVNVGSVGSPFDGDPRGSLGFFTYHGGQWHTEIRRFRYDRELAARRFQDSGFLELGGPLARVIFEEWKRAQPLLAFWRRQYESGVLSGEVELESSVERFLQDHR